MKKTYQRQSDAKDIEVEEQFWGGQLVGFGSSVAQIVWHDLQLRTQPAQGEHKDEEGAVLPNGCEDRGYPSGKWKEKRGKRCVVALRHSNRFS